MKETKGNEILLEMCVGSLNHFRDIVTPCYTLSTSVLPQLTMIFQGYNILRPGPDLDEERP